MRGVYSFISRLAAWVVSGTPVSSPVEPLAQLQGHKNAGCGVVKR